MQITVLNTRLDVKRCDSCEGMRVLADGVIVGHYQRSGIHHRTGHGLEVSKLCALGRRVYGGTVVRTHRSTARLAALRVIAGWSARV